MKMADLIIICIFNLSNIYILVSPCGLACSSCIGGCVSDPAGLGTGVTGDS